MQTAKTPLALIVGGSSGMGKQTALRLLKRGAELILLARDPADTLHSAPQKDLHFGFPYCHAGRIPDPQYGHRRSCGEFSQPAMELGPHVAALGMKFYTGSMFPPRYLHQIFIAEHGSWNRSVPIGYRITTVVFDKQLPVRYEIFAEGWLQGEKAWGRPVDVLVLKDGSLLVSDDRAGAIYRITYDRSSGGPAGEK